jgi:phage minor structural protein
MEYVSTNVIPLMRSATVKNVARSARAVFPWYGSGTTDLRLFTLDVGTQVFEGEVLTGIGTPYTHIKWPGGSGWILRSSLENFTDITMTSPTTATIEQYIPAPRSRMQLFRINSLSLTHTGVSASARHVFYDQQGNLTTYSTTSANAYDTSQALDSGKFTNKVDNHVGWNVQTNLTGTKDVSAWVRAPYIEAFMSPGNGMVAYWPGKILRDNWEVVLVDTAGMDRGVVIEYAKNLKGVTYSVDTSEIITGLLPVGQTYKGKPLVLPVDYYNPLAYTQNGVVYNANYNDYPVPHIGILDLGSKVKATSGTDAAKAVAYEKMFTAAMDEFTRTQCHLPPVTLNVDFLHLGDTEEYAQYRDLQKLFLYDTVRVKHPRLGIDVTTQVNKTVWNCLLDRYDGIELGSVRKNYARSRLAGWMVPGLDSLKSYVDTISGLI